MFQKSRIKIIIAIMGVFVLLFAGTLCVIYFSSYASVYKDNQGMLERYAEAYWKNGNPAENIDDPPELTPDEIRGERTFRLSAFYSVEFSADTGDVADIDNDLDKGMSDEHLVEMAQQILEKGKTSGLYGSFSYHIEAKGDRTLVALMDNEILSGNISTLLRYTILFGSITIVLLFLISFSLARRIVQPLEDSYQKQKQFISDAGHELKTPISVVGTNLEMLERDFGQSKWLDNIRFETGRMADLIRQLLELARAESSQPRMSRVDFGRIVTGGVLPFECIAFEKNRELQTEIQDGIFVTGNAEQLGNVVSILVDNALTYAPEHSAIAVSLRAERRRAFLTVSNEGAPIPEEQKKNLFERFYREDPSREGETAHYGLGLAIAKAILTSHHGKIEVNCEGNRVIFIAVIPTNS